MYELILTKKISNYLLKFFFFCRFGDNFSAILLFEINVLDIFNMLDFLRFLTHR